MAIDPKHDAAIALHRFGMGPRMGSIAAIASDPRGALVAELDRPGDVSKRELPTGGEAARANFDFQRERRAARLADRAERMNVQQGPGAAVAPGQKLADQQRLNAPGPSDAMVPNAMDAPRAPMSAAPGQALLPAGNPGLPQQLYLAEARLRLDTALGGDIGFIERLVWFWSNHFCVSADKGPPVRSLCGPFEREAIRTHVLGRFGDMLLAVESHPAMLFYLDNVRSIGPQSIAGRNRGAGLNENLAREILELHTLGVRTGYTQDDVTSFAKVITGWSIVPFKQDPAHGGEFTFDPRMHEPGAQTILGKVYPDGGFDQGRAILADIARHPSTAKHVATKLATHFVADTPPPALVDRLAKRFLETDGDLKDMAKTLVTSAEAWNVPRGKLKRPGEWIVGALRAVDATPPDIRPVIQAQNMLGEPLWRPPAPKGFSDDSTEWMPGLAERLDVADQLARRIGSLAEPDAVIDVALGPLASAETRATVKRAESRPQALSLLLMAPEFQRR
jgi:uncharacterized protein (DUF1800 family)